MNINLEPLESYIIGCRAYPAENVTPSWYVVHVSSVDGDWEGVYVNRDLICEAHSINFPRLLDVLINNLQGEIISFKQECAGDWLQETGSLPETLCEFYEENKK